MKIAAILAALSLLLVAVAVTTTASGPMIPFTVYGYTGWNGMIVRIVNMNQSIAKIVITQQGKSGKGFYQLNLGDMSKQWKRGNKIVAIGIGHYYYKTAYVPMRGYFMKMI